MQTLIKIQGELKAPKNQNNSFGKYRYRSCEDILEAVKPLCVKNEALLTLSDEIVEIASKTFVKATATFVHGDFKHEVTAFARHSEDRKGMDDSQITGATSSYARKYALNGLFCIDDSKDSDITNEEKRLPDFPNSYFGGTVIKLKSEGIGLIEKIKTKYILSPDIEAKLIAAAEL